MLKYKSYLYEVCETLLYVPLMLMGYKEQKQDIEVELISSYNQDPVSIMFKRERFLKINFLLNCNNKEYVTTYVLWKHFSTSQH